jgi:NAD(P)-dependent dehydrogenase (short-subunit alcohol dehydrogenase family)
MKTVVITGSGRGLGWEMAQRFRRLGLNVVLNEINQSRLEKAKEDLEAIPSDGKVLACHGDASNYTDLQMIIDKSVAEFGAIDIWINNAGVNQPMKPIWELTESEINRILDVDLKGAVIGSKLAMAQMINQGYGAIYNMEGYGSNDAMMTGLNMYGTSKRAVTHFTQALAKESEEAKIGVLVGRLSPGIMITGFTTNALGDKEAIDLPEKTKKFYNIVGDYPDVVADFLVSKILSNNKNNAHIQWLTNAKVMWRFMTAGFNKRDFFK